jgi:hypothetical protein
VLCLASIIYLGASCVASAQTEPGRATVRTCPYTTTSYTYQDIDWRNPYFRWNEDTPHSTGIRYIKTNGVAASDYVDMSAHDQTYHQPPNGYLNFSETFWVRAYTPYGTCYPDGSSSYDMGSIGTYLRA